MGNVLIIDDHLTTCTMLQRMIAGIHHEAVHCQNLAEGLDRIASGCFDVVFLDVNMPDGNGLEALKTIHQMSDPPEVIIITGAGDRDGAEIAIKNGAWGYLQKPLSPKEILLPVKRVLEYRENLKLHNNNLKVIKRDEIVGNSPTLNRCLEQLARAAENDSSVLLTGETGTGKDLFARVLHANSRRSSNRLVTVDCASLPYNLIADSLFGHEKGAFTGADRKTTGLIKLADGGSLFLDEIGELDPGLQKTLLRVLQEKKFIPVGGASEIASNFRLIAATNKDLRQMVADGEFREDLYFRIHTQSIELPALRHRKEDIELLMVHCLRRIVDRYKSAGKGFSPDYLETLLSYDWPGNVREFVNVIEESFHAAGKEPILFAKHLPATIRIQAISSSLDDATETATPNPELPLSRPERGELPRLAAYRAAILQTAEKGYLQRLMNVSEGDIQKACYIAGIGRTHLYNLLKKHAVSRTTS